MTAMRAPVVAGVGGGVGTTTVAAALRGHDAGRLTAGWPDILVCRGTLDSLRRAAAVLQTADPDAFPVLAVTLDAARAARRPIRAHLELLEPDLGALVVLPYVRRWTTLPDPVAEAAHLLEEPADRLPRPLRGYAAALRELVEAVTASGRLDAAPDQRTAVPRVRANGTPTTGVPATGASALSVPSSSTRSASVRPNGPFVGRAVTSGSLVGRAARRSGGPTWRRRGRPRRSGREGCRSSGRTSSADRPGPADRAGRVRRACAFRRSCAVRSSPCWVWRSARCPAATSPRRRRAWTPPASPPPRAATCRWSPTSPRSSARSCRRCGSSRRSRPSPAGIRQRSATASPGCCSSTSSRGWRQAARRGPPARPGPVTTCSIRKPTCGWRSPGCAPPCAPSRATSSRTTSPPPRSMRCSCVTSPAAPGSPAAPRGCRGPGRPAATSAAQRW